MNAMTRPGALDPRRHRAMLVLGAVVVVLVLAVLLGLNTLRPGAMPASSSGSSAGGGAPGLLQGANSNSGSVSPAAPPAGMAGTAGTAGTADAQSREAAGATGGQPKGSAKAAGTTVITAGAKIARTAWLGTKVKDITAASARARAIAIGAGGQVLSENIVTGADPTGAYGSKGTGEEGLVQPIGVNEARLTLSVPAEKLDPVLAELSSASFGTLSYWSSQSQDVTDSYVDTASRIQPAKDSIARVRALMVKATALDQIVLLESELSRRQADLDSLQQRLAELDRRTTTSEVSLTLWTDARTQTEPEGGGILQSLTKAWEALLASVMVVVTGLAVLLPWLLIALVVAWFVRRWLRRRGGATGRTGSATPAAD